MLYVNLAHLNGGDEVDYPLFLVALQEVVRVDSYPEHPPECFCQGPVVIIDMIKKHRLIADCKAMAGDLLHGGGQISRYLLVMVDVGHEVDILFRSPVESV